MSNQDFGLLEAINLAMAAEHEANQFYLAAVHKVSSEKGKDLLRQLAEFEQHHFDKLKELKNSLEKKGEFIQYQGTNFVTTTGRIPAEVSGKLESNKDEILNILNLAIAAEDKATKNYRNLAQATTDAKGKAMFERLAEEELSHRRILSDEFYHIMNKGAVWSWGD
ncbi:ferritin family protein [candidate division KSB1 bacterium]|nr:ferritin family protein [candidate division KSB1 bacterium]